MTSFKSVSAATAAPTTGHVIVEACARHDQTANTVQIFDSSYAYAPATIASVTTQITDGTNTVNGTGAAKANYTINVATLNPDTKSWTITHTATDSAGGTQTKTLCLPDACPPNMPDHIFQTDQAAAATRDNAQLQALCPATPANVTAALLTQDYCGQGNGSIDPATDPETRTTAAFNTPVAPNSVVIFTGNSVMNGNGQLLGNVRDTFPAGTLGPWTTLVDNTMTSGGNRRAFTAWAPVLTGGVNGTVQFDFGDAANTAIAGAFGYQVLGLSGVDTTNPFGQQAATPLFVAGDHNVATDVWTRQVTMAAAPTRPVLHITNSHHNKHSAVNNGKLPNDCGYIDRDNRGSVLTPGTEVMVNAGGISGGCQPGIYTYLDTAPTAAAPGPTTYTQTRETNATTNVTVANYMHQLSVELNVPGGAGGAGQEVLTTHTTNLTAPATCSPLNQHYVKSTVDGGSVRLVIAPGSDFEFVRQLDGVEVGRVRYHNTTGALQRITLPPIVGNRFQTPIAGGNNATSTDTITFFCRAYASDANQTITVDAANLHMQSLHT